VQVVRESEPEVRALKPGLGRAALFTVGAAMIAAAGCSDDGMPPPGTFADAYGTPPWEGGFNDAYGTPPWMGDADIRDADISDADISDAGISDADVADADGDSSIDGG